MRNYVVMCVLNIHRQFLWYVENQRKKQWQKPERVEILLRIGVPGLEALGGDITRLVAQMGFKVSGYSKSSRQIEGVSCFSRKSTPLEAFVAQVDTLVCLLPSTPDTEGILTTLSTSA